MILKFMYVNVIVALLINYTVAKKHHDKDIAIEKADKIRICIVENRGSFRRTEKYCPIIEKHSNIECIVGVDRLDCARRINKGYAHFGVFSSEDLVGARWATLEILVTSEIRFHSEQFEYEVVVVVDNEANIHTAADLKNSRLCHPGKGLEENWNDIIADYLESVMIPRQCEKDLTLAESRIKATANYFAESCKAGPWVNDHRQDKLLKMKYPSLCALCYDKARCDVGDKHWGRRGPLYCLTGASGQAAYVRLDDVRSFFGLTGLTPLADPNSYSFLCPDGHLQPLSVKNPCSWIAKPWPVIASRRSHAEKVQNLFDDIDVKVPWQQSLLMLLESYYVNITSLDTPMTIDDYLDKDSGYQSAHSFPACYPPRHIVYCTTSLIDFVKCSWLQEVSTVYGIEPNLQCIRGESLFRCLDDVNKNVADVVLVDQDARVKSERNFNLTSILFEYSSNFTQNYVTVAVVKHNSWIKKISDLQGTIACFPKHEGAAFHSVMNALQDMNLIRNNCSHSVNDFFSRRSSFGTDKYTGDNGALNCLNDFGEVAFVNLEAYQSLPDKVKKNYRVVCPPESKGNGDLFSFKHFNDCYFDWTAKGALLVNKALPQLRTNEIINSLKSMDIHFGKYKFKSGNIPFTLFGPFDQKTNVLFKDATDEFKTKYEMQTTMFKRNLEVFYGEIIAKPQYCSGSHTIYVFSIPLILLMIAVASL